MFKHAKGLISLVSLPIAVVVGVILILLFGINSHWFEKASAQGAPGPDAYIVTENRVFHPQAEAWIEQGFKHMNRQESEQAINAYSEAINIEKDSSSLYYIRGVSYFSVKDYDSAAADFSKASELYEGQNKVELASLLSQLAEGVKEKTIPGMPE
jgi:tetratricopeptide (TPR) repeat protein